MQTAEVSLACSLSLYPRSTRQIKRRGFKNPYTVIRRVRLISFSDSTMSDRHSHPNRISAPAPVSALLFANGTILLLHGTTVQRGCYTVQPRGRSGMLVYARWVFHPPWHIYVVESTNLLDFLRGWSESSQRSVECASAASRGHLLLSSRRRTGFPLVEVPSGLPLDNPTHSYIYIYTSDNIRYI